MVSVAVPPEDGSIQRALAELDARLSAWTAAMSSAQAALLSAAQRFAAPDDQAQVAPAPEELEAAPNELDGIDQAVASQTPPNVEAPPPTPVKVSEPAEPVAATMSVAEPEPAAPPRKAQPVAAPEPVAPPVEEAAPRKPLHDEDEALLATLDAETAKAIRVMRRLDFGRRSVAELLKEYQARETVGKPQASKGKSWWSRGKG